MDISLTIKENNPFKAKETKANLQMIANLEPDLIEKLAKLSQNSNAVSLFVSNFDELINL